ncbi:MAG: NTP transferase domain-containing protein [Balneolales bacterium]|nr:NTP transferase domain-containing protein [Balneolales bacterium]
MSTKIQLTNGIILAAGKNSRFDTGIPKSMHEIGIQTLLERQVRQLHRAGVRNIAVVVGYRGDVLEEYIRQVLNPKVKHTVDIIWNHDFEKANAHSIACAREWIEGQAPGPDDAFFCTMADHVFSDDFFSRVTREIKMHPPVEMRATLHLAVDMVSEHNLHIDVADVTKVKLDLESAIDTSEDAPSVTGAQIVEIGKGLSSYSYYDTGCFVLKSSIFDAVDRAIDTVGDGISDTVTSLVSQGQARVIDVSGLFWNDVDTPDDFRKTTELLQRY